jgi:hypothetical protein
MMHGTFLLADIHGYTAFLSDVGIEHAKEIIGHLFNRIVALDQDHWEVGNVSGDCLFLYSDGVCSPAETFTHLRRVYTSFRESIEEITSGSTCRCGACDRTGTLAIKFVVHAGEFDTQEIAGRRELIGPAIVVAHRLLKNSIAMPEYALMTSSVAEVANGSGLTAESGRDVYPDVGEQRYAYVDLRPLREAFFRSREIYVTEADADVAVSAEIEAPAEFIWRLCMNLKNGPRWAPTLTEAETLSGEMEEAGSVHTCLHGDVQMVHLRMAVDRDGYRLTDRLFKVPIVGEMYQTFELKPSASGTRFTLYYKLAPVDVFEQGVSRADMITGLEAHTRRDVQGLKALCEAEVRGIAGVSVAKVSMTRLPGGRTE